MSAAFELYLDRLPAGRSAFPLTGTLSLRTAEESPEPATCQVEGELAVDAMGEKVLVHGSFDVDRQLDCHRCAQPSRQQYEAELEILILRGPARGPAASTEEDAWVVTQQGGMVPLDRPLGEAVFLHEPQKVLCQEDCQGVCPSCGQDRNVGTCSCSTESVDPRWDALKKLRDASDPDSEAPS